MSDPYEDRKYLLAEAFLRRRKACFWWGLAGSIVLSVMLPTLLVCFSQGAKGVFIDPPRDPELILDKPWQVVASQWFNTELGAVLFCGPGAAVLGFLLFRMCASGAEQPIARLIQCVGLGMFAGIFTNMLNLPCFVFAASMRNQERFVLKLALLYLVFGSMSGAWIGWQAWRATHPEERFWPRYSLGMLMIAVMAWGALLAVFAPR